MRMKSGGCGRGRSGGESSGEEQNRGRTMKRLSLPLGLVLIFSQLSLHFHQTDALPETIRIGGLFDVSDRFEETAFRHALERVNEDQNVLPRSRLSAHWERVPSNDSFHASKKLCRVLNDGVAAIIGPQSQASVSHVQSVCDVVGVPHAETVANYRSIRGNYGINLYPHPAVLTRAYADVITAWGWEKYIIIYDDDESLIRLQDILKDSEPSRRQVFVKQLPPDGDYRPLFKSLTKQSDISNLILDCDTAKLPKIFEDAESTGMLKDKKYFLTSLDIHALDPERFANMDINITSLRLVDPTKPKAQSIITQWQNIVIYGFPNRTYSSHYFVDEYSSFRSRGPKTAASSNDRIEPLPNDAILTKAALMYDAVELIARGLHALDTSQFQQQRIDLKSLNCKKETTWGPTVLEAIRKTMFEGVTGIVEIDPTTGFRNQVQFDVMELTHKTGLAKIGMWDSRRQGDRLTWTRTAEETLRKQEEDLKDKTFIVVTRLGDPYAMYDAKTGNYSGFVVDLVSELAKEMHFKFIVKEVSDGGYGGLDRKTGLWNGMIGDILSGRGDLAVADLTINHDREAAVDFTMPFMNLGISILYKKPKKEPPELFSFLQPFSPDIWIYMATAFLGVSLILFVLARMTPYEWVSSHPCIKDPDELENNLTLTNSLWFSIGSLMQQGSDIAPRAMSTRSVAGMWWFFTLIMISSYTANLAAFLTMEGFEEGITDVASLPTQSKVKYGCLETGTTAKFFRESSFPLYKEIWNSMANMKPSPFENKNSDGIKRVNQSAGTYAFFMESVSIEYHTQRECSLTQLGGLLDSKGYGIALKKNSKYREAFNSKVLEFAEKGLLQQLKHRWWVEYGGGQCPSVTVSSSGAKPLTMANVGGVFVVLLGGCVCATLMAVIEFLWKSRKLGRNEDENKFDEMVKELRFALQCQGDKKPVKKSKPPTQNPSLAGSTPYLPFAKKDPSE
ncbi:glutamate receptor ionotropic, kainate 2 isoform X2 [Folsomia candida]|uniref:glutamate receptor ionotropic, kainate 2 isoform X2 n=1 Tax=Folsomia candida TaxID=158441 RepID=UPI001604F853|nr:glutamate receptor ionotropic, kainate 2 isoform X2 [Folsomia candida]